MRLDAGLIQGVDMGKRISIKRRLWQAYGILLIAMTVILFIWWGLVYLDSGYMEDACIASGGMFSVFVAIALIMPIIGSLLYKRIK